MYTKPQILSGSSEQIMSWFDLQTYQWCKSAATVQCNASSDSPLHITYTYCPLVCFFTATLWSRFNGIWNFLKRDVTAEMQRYKRQGFQCFPFKLEARIEEIKQGFQAVTQPSPGDTYFMSDHMLLWATCFHCKPELSKLSLGWMLCIPFILVSFNSPTYTADVRQQTCEASTKGET